MAETLNMFKDKSEAENGLNQPNLPMQFCIEIIV